MFFIAYAFKGQVHVFAKQVKIVSHLSCRTSAIFKYFCPLEYKRNGSVDECSARLMGGWFETRTRHRVVSLSKTLYPKLLSGQTRFIQLLNNTGFFSAFWDNDPYPWYWEIQCENTQNWDFLVLKLYCQIITCIIFMEDLTLLLTYYQHCQVGITGTKLGGD